MVWFYSSRYKLRRLAGRCSLTEGVRDLATPSSLLSSSLVLLGLCTSAPVITLIVTSRRPAC